MLVGCGHFGTGSTASKPCPTASDETLRDIARLDPYEDAYLLLWIAEIERYCTAVEARAGRDVPPY